MSKYFYTFFILILTHEITFSQDLKRKDLKGTWYTITRNDTTKITFNDNSENDSLIIESGGTQKVVFIGGPAITFTDEQYIWIKSTNDDHSHSVMAYVRKVNDKLIKAQVIDEHSNGQWKKETTDNTLIFVKEDKN